MTSDPDRAMKYGDSHGIYPIWQGGNKVNTVAHSIPPLFRPKSSRRDRSSMRGISHSDCRRRSGLTHRSHAGLISRVSWFNLLVSSLLLGYRLSDQ